MVFGILYKSMRQYFKSYGFRWFFIERTDDRGFNMGIRTVFSGAGRLVEKLTWWHSS